MRGGDVGRFRPERQRTFERVLRIDHAECHRWRARPVRGDKAETVGAGLFVNEVIDIALAIDRNLLRLMARDRHIAH